jgi:hypothetical protein
MGIDIGMIALARTQAQQAADAAAMTATRTLNGGANANVSGAVTNGQNIAAANTILSDPILTSDVTINIGAYHYDAASQTFSPQYPAIAPDTSNLAQAIVTHKHPSAFGAVMNLPTQNVSATAIAAYRPRDVAIILDYSGSMNNESDLWNIEAYNGSYYNTSNNADPVFPQWGPYAPSFSPLAALQQTASTDLAGMCNVTASTLGMPAMVNDFFQHTRGSTPTIPAFNLPPATVTTTTPGGDKYLPKQGSSNPTRTWQDITGSSATAFQGYAAANGTFYGWTQGPGYWGKTFFIWPPDPNPARDWRKLYFMKTGGTYPNFGGPMNDNTMLWTSSGLWNGNPVGSYVINYKAILAWIKANCVQSSTTDPKPFPPLLRAGRILYYDNIPTDVPSQAYDHTQTNASIPWTDQSQRFWKEYIDYVIGVWRDPYGNVQNPPKPACSLGGDFTCGSSTGGNGVSISGPDNTQGGLYPSGYIAPTDNPKRPRHRFWFGPMTMIQFMSDTGLLPGTVKDISMSVAKLGINGALVDIQNNHPNDLVSMILFSRPQYSNDPPGTGAFNNVQYALCRDYQSMINSLWYPPNSSTADVRPWDASGSQTPRAHADYNANTATSYGFMLAYNQMSSNPALASTIANGQPVGGLGRKGAQRILILETDGMANEDSVAVSGFANNGPNQSYYHILPGDTVNGAGFNGPALYEVVQAICNKADGTPGNLPGYSTNPGYPGYSTTAKPVIIHTLAFGVIFEPDAGGTEAATAIAIIQQISTIGGTIFPSSPSDPVNGYKWIIGTLTERQTKLQKAFGIIMDQGVSVSMIK